jgi:aspartate-semialdehyde dehydrogenase
VRPLNVGVVGATGMVGKAFMEILMQRKFPVKELRPFASDASIGKKIPFDGREFPCQGLAGGCFKGLDIVFFSSGDEISAEWAPRAVEDGAWAIDNSNAFRMKEQIPLVVSEVNGEIIKDSRKPTIIANPNCTTMQLVVALKPLQKAFGLSEVRVSSYQAVSGAGVPGYEELQGQVANPATPAKTFAQPIAFNCVPEIGSFNELGFTSEEMKVMNETKKILDQKSLKVSAFTVRVPVYNAHSETVWVTFDKEVSRVEVLTALKSAPGLVVESEARSYATPKQVSGQDPVYVGRIHQDLNDKKTWMMWIVSDNIRKGAALNGIQIAEMMTVFN